jgi:hypothetical protein
MGNGASDAVRKTAEIVIRPRINAMRKGGSNFELKQPPVVKVAERNGTFWIRAM